MKSAAPSLADQLRQAIRETGQSLTQLGKAAGLDSGRLSRFLRGEGDLSLTAAARLCQVLHLHLVRDGNSAAAGQPRSQSDYAAFRRAQARALAEAVFALERDAKREDFAACTHAVFSQLHEAINALEEAPLEGNARALFRLIRNTFLNSGWQRYRTVKVRRGVAAILENLANTAAVIPREVDTTYDKLRALGLDPVGVPLPGPDSDDEWVDG
jgi:transcriptional regulator with XRE-family HTH domain